MYFFFDTETTGLFDFKAPATAPHQPHICQIGAIVTDEEGRTMSEFNMLCKLEGATIHPGAQAVHGITPENCELYGAPPISILSTLNHMAAPCRLTIAHNRKFDAAICDAAFQRIGGQVPMNRNFTKQLGFCTMEATTDLLKLPGFKGKYKWPKLQEAYKYFFGKEFEGAHDAMLDIRATRDVFFALKARGLTV